MNRFFMAKSQLQGDLIRFPRDISHQIRNVLRLKPGDVVEAAGGDGWIHRVKIQAGPENMVRGKIIATYFAESEPGLRVHLFFGLTQREKTEWILQKGTEVGVSAFHPFISRRTLIQNENFNPHKRARWERIIREAAEQSMRGRQPELMAPIHLEGALAAWDGGEPVLAGWVGERSLSLRTVLKEMRIDKEIGIVIGPEGGFDPGEVERMRSLGVQIFSLGRRILRVETAAILVPALVLYELGAMDASE